MTVDVLHLTGNFQSGSRRIRNHVGEDFVMHVGCADRFARHTLHALSAILIILLEARRFQRPTMRRSALLAGLLIGLAFSHVLVDGALRKLRLREIFNNI